MMPLTTNVRVWQILLIIFLLMSGLFYILFYFRTIFITFVVGMALIIVTEKMMKDYKKRMRKYNMKGNVAKIIGFAIVFFWVFVVFFTIGSSVSEFTDVLDKVKVTSQSFTRYYITQIEPYVPVVFSEMINDIETLRKIEQFTFSVLRQILSGFSVFVLNSILIIPIMFYMYFRKRRQIIRKTYGLVPERIHDSFQRSINDIGKRLHDFLSAKVFESIIVGSICCFGFYVAGLKGWLVLGILAGFLNIVPYLGPILGAIPPLLVAFLDQPIVALYVLITVLIAQIVDNLYLIPFMITSRVNVDPLLGIVLILTGAQLFGIMGMIFAIPIYLVYKIVLKESYHELVNVYDAAKQATKPK